MLSLPPFFPLTPPSLGCYCSHMNPCLSLGRCALIFMMVFFIVFVCLLTFQMCANSYFWFIANSFVVHLAPARTYLSPLIKFMLDLPFSFLSFFFFHTLLVGSKALLRCPTSSRSLGREQSARAGC